MRWKEKDRKLARRFRSEGLTYSEIRKKIGKSIPKSTLSYWCRGVKLPKFYEDKVKQLNFDNLSRALKLAVSVNREKRAKFLGDLRQKNLHLLKYIDNGVLKLILAIFYLAEGAKHPSTRFLRFGSSDPETIKFFLRSLEKLFKTDSSKYRVDILCRADQDLEKLKKYWIRVTGIDESLFYKPRVDKRTIGKKTKKKNYKGVCVVNYFDTSIQLELQLLGEEIVRRV
ncbi:hypothetical protein KKD62_02660 [Patescibacteria group bacterium]|nr:hypothetical protein [Patescibacteria group bacterium]MBU1931842.1 hypothetical protein [Patescibacteria group bacterium]